MSVLNATTKSKDWWFQFPSKLRLITSTRFLASIGAGGVIYLTPLVFNQLDFSATSIGTGLAAAALTGTVARLVTGGFLDKGVNSSLLIRLACFVAIIADFYLFRANNYENFLKGQILLGIAAGIYWPSVEISVPISCEKTSSSKGFALVRSADALGVSIGALIGSFAAWLNIIRLIYIVDISSMLLVISLLTISKTKYRNISAEEITENSNKIKPKSDLKHDFIWIKKIIPILIISLLSTGIFALLQSALPIDLVRGGLHRPPLSAGWSSCLIAVQLGLLVIFQWPIGVRVSRRSINYGLRLSLICFSIGCFLLCLSNILEAGVLFALIAQVPMAIGLASFLPTATEGIIKISPLRKRGVALALFSQCFAISAILVPLASGKIIDSQGNGILVWLVTGIFSILLTPLTNK